MDITQKIKNALLTIAIVCSFGILSSFSIDNSNSEKNEISFEFYSSREQNIRLSYKFNLKEEWKYVEMVKDGYKFSANLNVDEDIWYEFVTDEDIRFKRDPFNSDVKNGRPYISNASKDRTSNRNNDAKFVSSEHFDLFTTVETGESDIKELERLYDKLGNETLSFLNEGKPLDFDRKIRYYSGIYKGMYCMSWTGEVVDDKNILNSHEIIHAIIYDYPKFPPFAEGIAQCFQERGNKKPLVERNPNLAAKNLVVKLDLYDVLSDWKNNGNYHIVGSFIYYNIFVNLESRENFTELIKSLTSQKNKFHHFNELFEIHMKKDLKTAIKEWEKWVVNIDENSDIYVNWN